MKEQFSRTEMLLGPESTSRLAAAHVMVFGLGGVGSYAVEALARAGIGRLTLVDEDTVSVTNLNRQLGALHSTLGMSKAEALAARVRDINPDCRVLPLTERYDAEHRERFFREPCDYIVDAIDLVSCKLDLIETAMARGIPILSALGTGNKLDASQFRVTDISKTEGCPLARIIRKELRARGIVHHRVVFSPEPARAADLCGEAPPPGRRSIPASAPWVPAVAGLLMAGDVIQTLAQGAEKQGPTP